MFVPGSYVPLSEFTDTANEAVGEVDVHVDPLILDWLDTNDKTLRIAVQSSTGVAYHKPSRVNPTSGRVLFKTALVGNFVAVADGLSNDLPIVTHWDQSKNGGRGGRQSGARDGIMRIVVQNPAVGFALLGASRIYNFNPAFADPAGVDQPYFFRTNDYALFSDGTESQGLPGVAPSDALVPAYERYIAENWSLVAPSDMAAIWLSDWLRSEWGLPIAHKNQPVALDASQWGPKKALAGLPLLQLVHGHEVRGGDRYPDIPGSEDSLATFVLPPFWKKVPGDRYPILFNGYYDLNASTFLALGPVFLDRIAAEFVERDRQAIGVLWNGGGARVAHTFQRSAYDNGAQLLWEAASMLSGDRHRVVAAGTSRGGNTALLLAANPYYPALPTPQWPGGHPFAYTVRFALADVPHLRLGDNIQRFSNPTYAFVQNQLRESTGYQRAWEPLWVQPTTGESAAALAQRTLFGTSDTAAIDAALVPDSAPMVAQLVERGTGVVLRAGTHDFSRPFFHASAYVDTLRAAGVPVEFEIHHRFGHQLENTIVPTLGTLVDKLFAKDYSIADTTEHRRPSLTDPAIAEPFTPGLMPPILEAPLEAGWAQPVTFTVHGPVGAHYQVRICPADPVTLACLLPQSLPFLFGILTPERAGASQGVAVHEIDFATMGLPVPVVPQTWRAELSYSLDAGQTFGPPLAALASSLFGGDPLLPTMAVFTLHPLPVLGAHIGTRTGGLGADGDF